MHTADNGLTEGRVLHIAGPTAFAQVAMRKQRSFRSPSRYKK
nr:MAG TPA: hypothetical protein [Caudoviricetes sp.]